MVGAVLFLALCAYMGAGLLEKLRPDMRTVQAVNRSITESAALCGIAIRREQAVCSPDGQALSAEFNTRYSAAECALIFGSENSSPCLYLDNFDGFEYLDPDTLSSFSSELFSELMNTKPANMRGCAGRLVKENVWYFAARVESGTIPQKGSKCSIIFDGFEESCQASVWAVDKDCILLRLTTCSPELLSIRKSDARLIFGQYEGIEIPRQALHRNSEGEFYVCVLSAGLVENRSVDIIYTDKNLVLSRPLYSEDALREGETIILEVVSDEYS